MVTTIRALRRPQPLNDGGGSKTARRLSAGPCLPKAGPNFTMAPSKLGFLFLSTARNGNETVRIISSLAPTRTLRRL
ncbi:hypothetical protein HYQ46_012003 [Verticillium longisporum]|nr:hypothetical protein HYQ46_012003 [Verticillium longisporum]